MKKTLSVLFAAVLLLCVSVPFAAADNGSDDIITIELFSDIAGLSYKDSDRIVKTDSDKIILRTENFQISDYAGDVYLDKMKAGRTYYLNFEFVSSDDYIIPTELDAMNLTVSCADGVKEMWKGIGTGYNSADTSRYHVLMMSTVVKVDGNVFQRVLGSILDFFLKLSAWSPY